MDPLLPPPDPRLRVRRGQYDNPPASESSTPRTRRTRLHQALRATADMAANDLAEMGASTQSRRAQLGPLQRRRQRSPITGSPASDSRDVGSEDNRRRRPKRRKLDTESSLTPKQPIKYGYYGQVEPGRLLLDIISCDGGEHRDPRSPNLYLGPQNVLRHDKSVYCSDRPNSSIMLRHSDDTPFCLEKLHIVGPEHGFTAPVREGIVYVAMTLDDLKKYMDPPQHARVRGVHSPPYRRQRSFRTSEERITLSEALRDPEVNESVDEREQRAYYNRMGMGPGAPPARDGETHYYANTDSNTGFGHDDTEAHCELPSGEADNIIVSADDRNPPITVLSDEEPDPEESSTQEVLDFRQQRMRAMSMRRRFDVDNWDNEGRWNGPNTIHIGGEGNERDSSWNLRHLDSMMARSRMDDSPRRSDRDDDRAYTYDRRDPGRDPRTRMREARNLRDDRDEEDPLLDETERYDDGLNDPDVTRARFHIREGKYKVAIRFDPPVSGRFMLLKIWANRSNVDLQSVIAKGYGSCRFFGAVEMR